MVAPPNHANKAVPACAPMINNVPYSVYKNYILSEILRRVDFKACNWVVDESEFTLIYKLCMKFIGQMGFSVYQVPKKANVK